MITNGKKLRYARIYLAYFFERPITLPISVVVLASSFETALDLVRGAFPERTISALHAFDNYRTVADFSAVLTQNRLPSAEPKQLPRNFSGTPLEVEKYISNMESDKAPQPGGAA